MTQENSGFTVGHGSDDPEIYGELLSDFLSGQLPEIPELGQDLLSPRVQAYLRTIIRQAFDQPSRPDDFEERLGSYNNYLVPPRPDPELPRRPK